MNTWNRNVNTDDRKDGDVPPFSRIFIVCSKQINKDDLRPHFEKYGQIQDMHMPRDRNTGESKGIAYIKYVKTSSAAAAIQHMNLKKIDSENKPIKVMVASNNRNDNNQTGEERYKRLFIKVDKQATRVEIVDHFSSFGSLESVHIQKDKNNDNVNRGFAYINYKTFLDAAVAFEECDRKYKPMFATPKDERKRSGNGLDPFINNSPNLWQLGHSSVPMEFYPSNEVRNQEENGNTLIKSKPQGYDSVNVTCSPLVPQKYLEKLFNIVPGVAQFQYSSDVYNGICKATVKFDDEKSAAHAVERVNNFEFPSGEIVSVKADKNPINKAASELTNIVNNFKNAIDGGGSADLMQLADAIAQASNLIKAATRGNLDSVETKDNNYNMNLPPPQSIVNSDSTVAQRCFVVCKPKPLPLDILRDLFCRFGDLIDITIFPRKNYGFVKFASLRAARDAMKTLNGVTVHGVLLKVLEADERPTKDENAMEACGDENGEEQFQKKKMKFENENKS